MARLIVLLLALLVATPALAQDGPRRVTMTDGSVFEGLIVERGPSWLVLQLPEGDQLELRIAAILRIQVLGPLRYEDAPPEDEPFESDRLWLKRQTDGELWAIERQTDGGLTLAIVPSAISLVSGIVLTKIGLDNNWNELLVLGEVLTVGSIIPATVGTEVVRHGMQLEASTRLGEAGFTLSAVGGSLSVLFANLAKADAGGMRDPMPVLLTVTVGAQLVGEAVMVANAALSVAAVKDEADRRHLSERSSVAVRSLWLAPNQGGLLAGISGTF